jgi:AAA domain
VVPGTCHHAHRIGVNLDPSLDPDARRRSSDGRSIWIEPIAGHHTSAVVLAQEELILTWALDQQQPEPQPCTTVERGRLDLLQHDAARAVAGLDRLVIIVGPAGTGKTTMLTAGAGELRLHNRNVFAVAPTAKAARTLAAETGMPADTVAKLVYEWSQPDRPPRPQWRLPAEATLIVDEAGMLGTNDLHRLTVLAETQRWRLILVGDPRQLQAVGRGGMFNELATGGRSHQLETIHRFNHPWEAAASLALRSGDPSVLDVYEAKGRIIPGSLDQHLTAITSMYADSRATGHSLAITTTTNEHVLVVNKAIQQHLVRTGVIDPTVHAVGALGQRLHVGDQIATRANNRQLKTSHGDIVRNRELWTITGVTPDGDIDARRLGSDDTVVLPADYVAEHVHLGYTATEHGNQSDTQYASLTLVTPTTTGRGLYVAMTRGRETNLAYVITGEQTIEAARTVLEGVIASDRADIPAVVQRRQLAAQTPAKPVVPMRRPRCGVPEWFAPVRAAAVGDFDRVNEEIHEIDTGHDNEAMQLTDAKTALRTAKTALVPFEAPYRDMLGAVTQAKTLVTAAEAAVREWRWIGRRPANHQLTTANQQLAEAETALATLVAHRDPHVRAFNEAERRHDALVDGARSRDLLDRYKHLPEQHLATSNVLVALDIWHDWATGGTPPVKHESWAVETLESPDQHPDRQSFKALAEAIRTRTPELVLTRPRTVEIQRNEPELDLGIGL